MRTRSLTIDISGAVSPTHHALGHGANHFAKYALAICPRTTRTRMHVITSHTKSLAAVAQQSN